MKLDILVFAVHPDDAELSCSGTIAAHIAQGYQCGIIDLTKGEMGTRGTPELRMKEASHSSDLLGLTIRENLSFEDVKFENDWDHQMEVVKMIRKYQPDIVLANAIKDRHSDHPKGAQLLQQSFFKSGLRKIQTVLDGQEQQAYRPRKLYHYIQTDYIEPDFIVDISDFWEAKRQSIMAFKSQFYDPDNQEPQTFISSPEFLEFIEARAKAFGHRIGVKYGEGFTTSTTPGTGDIISLL
jgi:bacillithiol biosynthesis deacetylase BshB1